MDIFAEEGTESRALYDAFIAALVALEFGAELNTTSRWLELFILTLNGLAPSWSNVRVQRADRAGDRIRLQPRAGGLLCPNCRQRDCSARPVGDVTVKMLRLLAREPLSRIVQVRLPPEAVDRRARCSAAAIRAATEHDLRSPLVLERMHMALALERGERDGVH